MSEAHLDKCVSSSLVSLRFALPHYTPLLASASTWLEHHLLKLHGPAVYLFVALAVFLEVAIVIGFFVPGEIAAITGGVLASQHKVSLLIMVVVVAIAAVGGNFVGYEFGRLTGPWLLSHRPLKDHPAALRAQSLIRRRGGPAVFLGRWVAVVRALVPGIAGVSSMDRRVFGIFSIVGGVAWATTWVLAGYAAGISYTRLVNSIGVWSLAIVAVLVLSSILYFAWRRIRERHRRGNSATCR